MYALVALVWYRYREKGMGPSVGNFLEPDLDLMKAITNYHLLS